MKKKYRSCWISDVHLGTRGCQAEILLDFLNNHTFETLYLVGDIIDGWVMSRGVVYWPQSHTNVIRKILSKAKNGTKVIFVSGNHDEFLRKYNNESDLTFGNITVVDSVIHTALDDKKYLVVHGDQFDIVTRYHKWLAVLGDYGYRFLIWLNTKMNKIRQQHGLGYWSLSKYVKHKVKQAVNFIGEYESMVAKSCEHLDVSGVICGHIHHAEIKQIGNITYMNDGDWVESCTALIEDYDGQFSIIHWGQEKLES
jgi:UDP-2,3-diacylglucosamine pyrophosphatase LpxH